MSYIDSLKCEEFNKNADKYFEIAKMVNFDIIHHQCRGDPLSKNIRKHQRVKEKNLHKYK